MSLPSSLSKELGRDTEYINKNNKANSLTAVPLPDRYSLSRPGSRSTPWVFAYFSVLQEVTGWRRTLSPKSGHLHCTYRKQESENSSPGLTGVKGAPFAQEPHTHAELCRQVWITAPPHLGDRVRPTAPGANGVPSDGAGGSLPRSGKRCAWVGALLPKALWQLLGPYHTCAKSWQRKVETRAAPAHNLKAPSDKIVFDLVLS